MKHYYIYREGSTSGILFGFKVRLFVKSLSPAWFNNRIPFEEQNAVTKTTHYTFKMDESVICSDRFLFITKRIAFAFGSFIKEMDRKNFPFLLSLP
jgi:hypothetical protein